MIIRLNIIFSFSLPIFKIHTVSSSHKESVSVTYIFLPAAESAALGVSERRRMLGLSYSSIDMARDMRRSTPGGGREVSIPWPWQKSSSDWATFAGWNGKNILNYCL